MKVSMGINVLDAARKRIAEIFDKFPRILVSFSGGKDSTVMLHLVAEAARDRGRRIGVLFIDLEAQYKATIDHIEQIRTEHADVMDFYWIALPLRLRNAVSQFEPRWTCWDPAIDSSDWVRPMPSRAVSDPDEYSWFTPGMEFEEFTVEFAKWYSRGKPLAVFVGIRCDESLNRYRTIASTSKRKWDGRGWTTVVADRCANAYPIYDWSTEDIWTYVGREHVTYNKIYDLMHRAGVSIHQARICQPYGDDQRRGLWLYHVLEPKTWARVVARVNGANSGALYARDSGNIQGMRKITCPDGMTWESFARLLLDSMPANLREHYCCKIAVFIRWFDERGVPMADEGPIEKGHANWRRICKALLRNDYWCKGLSFTQTKSDAYDKYVARRRKQRREWGILAS